jgi:hypothetical protein
MRARLLRVFDAVFPAPAALSLAVAGATASAAVVATTLAPGGPLLPTWVTWPLFLGIFPVHLRTVRTLLLERADLKARVFAKPRALLVPAATLVACAFVLSMQAVLTMRGNPERHGNGYYLDRHGALTRVSRSEYRYAERELERVFAGLAFVFYAAGILVHFPPGTPRARALAARS